MRSQAMILAGIGWLAVAMLLCLPAVSQAFVLYEETFGGTVNTPINGAAPTTENYDALAANTWIGAPLFEADGLVDCTTCVNNEEGGLSVPFEPQDGAIYTLTATMHNEFEGWVGVGFAGNSATTAVSLFNRHSNDMNGRLWGLTRNHPTGNDQEVFLGNQATNSIGGVTGANLLTITQDITLEIILNTNDNDAGTTGIQWAYQITWDDGIVAVPPTASATLTEAQSNTLRDNINFVGFSRDQSTAGSNGDATILSFSLETDLTPGDTNGNGIVDSTDFQAIADNLFSTGTGPTRAIGDVAAPWGTVDLRDFREWKYWNGIFGSGAGSAAGLASDAPEPNSVALLAIAGMLMAILSRRRIGNSSVG